jgi:hypothetical protein
MKPFLETVTPEQGTSWAFLDRRLPAGIPFEWHQHPEFELTLTLNSRGYRYIGDDVAPYDHEDLVLVGPGIAHSWHSREALDPGLPHVALVAWFTRDWVQGLAGVLTELTSLVALLDRAQSGLAFSGSTRQVIAPMMEAIRHAGAEERALLLLQILTHLARDKQAQTLTNIQRKLLDIECDMRGTLRNFGLRIGAVSTGGYEARIRHLVEGLPGLAAIIEPLLSVRRVMRQQLAVLHKMLLDRVRQDPVCRRFMTVPGVGPVVALTYRASVDQPHRFVHSRAVGAHAGLTPRRHQSGEIDYDGAVSKCGDVTLRAMLYEAAQSMLTHSQKWSWLKAWATRVAQRRGMRRAIVALARRLAVILHRMWVDGTDFRWTNGETVAPAA